MPVPFCLCVTVTLSHHICFPLLPAPPVPGLPEFDRGYSVPLSDDDSVNGLSVTHFTMEDAESKGTGVEYFCASDARWVRLYCITHVVVTSDDKE